MTIVKKGGTTAGPGPTKEGEGAPPALARESPMGKKILGGERGGRDQTSYKKKARVVF